MYERLRLPRIEARPKRVHRSTLYTDRVDLKNHPDLAQELLAIIRAIEKGHILPDRFYRRDLDTTTDALLDQHGIMHLHLGTPDTPELVFLVQYADGVVLLEIDDHRHFSTLPPGKLLRQLHELKLIQWEKDRAAERQRQAESVKAHVRERLLGKDKTGRGD